MSQNDSMPDRYEVLSHTADTGVTVRGVNLREVFENAAFAMFDLMFDLEGCVPSERVWVDVEANTIEDLLVDWLSTLLFEAETNALAFGSFEFDALESDRVCGWARGFSTVGVELAGPPIKAVTYHEVTVKQDAAGWMARVVFDV